MPSVNGNPHDLACSHPASRTHSVTQSIRFAGLGNTKFFLHSWVRSPCIQNHVSAGHKVMPIFMIPTTLQNSMEHDMCVCVCLPSLSSTPPFKLSLKTRLVWHAGRLRKSCAADSPGAGDRRQRFR